MDKCQHCGGETKPGEIFCSVWCGHASVLFIHCDKIQSSHPGDKFYRIPKLSFKIPNLKAM